MPRIVRKLVILALLLASLGAVVARTGVRNAYALICCSACEVDPPPLPCRHGCSPSC